jgi:hypothetical protein
MDSLRRVHLKRTIDELALKVMLKKNLSMKQLNYWKNRKKMKVMKMKRM